MKEARENTVRHAAEITHTRTLTLLLRVAEQSAVTDFDLLEDLKRK